MKLPAQTRPSIALLASIVAAFAGSFVIFAEYFAVSTVGSLRPKLLSTFVVLPLLVSVLAVPAAATACLFARTRRVALQVLIGSTIFAAIVFVSFRVGKAVRTAAFESLARRSAPLITAIKAYEQAHDAPPPTLDVLVPDYLPAIPTTGMKAYSHYAYAVGENGSLNGNPWRLDVFTPSGFLNFDHFYYYPLQNYEAKLGFDPVELIEDWAYVHE